MELTPSWEAFSRSATQKLSKILWNPKFHYRVQNSYQLVPILSHMNQINTNPFYLSKIHFNIVTYRPVARQRLRNKQLDNDRYCATWSKQLQKNGVFCTLRAESLLLRVSWVELGWVSWLVSELVDELRELLRFSCCEKLVVEAGDSSGTQRKENILRWKPLPSNG
jgi:hypothetical protein